MAVYPNDVVNGKRDYWGSGPVTMRRTRMVRCGFEDKDPEMFDSLLYSCAMRCGAVRRLLYYHATCTTMVGEQIHINSLKDYCLQPKNFLSDVAVALYP
jgi:hypothetical protein